MAEHLTFADRAAFHKWLSENATSSEGVWLIFGKKGGPATLSANDALEEALCFGWIDGQMQRIDESSYKKYFARRRDGSKWSEKNKALVQQLEQKGLLTDHGKERIEYAKAHGGWDNPKPPAIAEDQINYVAALLGGHEPARTNFIAMSPSVKRTYTRAYLDAKTENGRQKRLQWMIDRLNKNLKPM